MTNKNPYIGGSLDDFLKEKGFLTKAGETALRETLPKGKERARLWKWWKRAGITVSIAGLAGILWSSSIWYHYQRTLPRQATLATGHIYPLNVHGVVVYQTRDERNRLDGVQYSSAAVFIAGLLMGAFYRKRFGWPPAPTR